FLPDEGSLAGARIDPGLALRVVNQRRVGHDLPRSKRLILPGHLLLTNLICFETEPLDRLLGQRHSTVLRPLDALDLGGALGLDLGRRWSVFARRKLQTSKDEYPNH